MPFDAEHFAPVRLLDRDPKSLTDPRERLEYLRDFLRELPAERFDMRTVGSLDVCHECDSPACIGGWARAFWGRRLDRIQSVGTEKLGIDPDDAEYLMFPVGGRLPNGERAFLATPTQAANVLDHLLKTGEVDWAKA